MSELWRGIHSSTREILESRDYSAPALEQRLATSGLDASSALSSEGVLREAGAWIPGVEIFHRTIHPQRNRGVFGELGREGDGLLGKIGLWPRQWAAARMYAGSAKGFHIHPPYVPEGKTPEAWFKYLYAGDENYAKRPYTSEQWDVMFFLEGRAEMILVDERAGLARRVMRIFFDGDNHRGPNNAALVIPAGVAHALRAEGSEDLIMVYGTTTTFTPEYEGRIASGVETLSLPPEWTDYLSKDSR